MNLPWNRPERDLFSCSSLYALAADAAPEGCTAVTAAAEAVPLAEPSPPASRSRFSPSGPVDATLRLSTDSAPGLSESHEMEDGERLRRSASTLYTSAT